MRLADEEGAKSERAHHVAHARVFADDEDRGFAVHAEIIESCPNREGV